MTAVDGRAVNGDVYIFLCGSGTPEDPSRLYGGGTGGFCNWQLTDEDYDDRIPKEIVFPGSDRIVSLEVSDCNVFAISGGQDPGIYIWGVNNAGQTGEGTISTGSPSAPYKLTGYHTSPPVRVSAVQGSTVVLHEDGTLWLWGQDSLLQPSGTPYDEVLGPTQLPIYHVISYLTYSGENTRVGLFGWISERGQVKNLGLEQVSISVSGGYDDYYVGGIVGHLNVNVTLRQCYNTADIWLEPWSYCGRSAYLGGIAGVSYSAVSECYNLGDVGSGQSDSGPYYEMVCGGIVGKVEKNSRYLYVERCVVLSPEVSAYMDWMPGSMGSSGPFKASVLGTDVSTSSSGMNYYQSAVVTRGEGTLSKKGASDVSQTKLHIGGWYQDTAKWDFEQCWAWDKAENGGLPYFQWKTGACLLLSYDGKQVRLYCGSNTPAVALRVAAYDGEGRLLCVSTAMPELSPGVNTVPLTLEQEGAVIKVFLWRAANSRPLARSLTL